MNVIEELFAIPSGEKYILFAPLEGVVMETNLKVLALLKECKATGMFPEGEVRDALFKNRILFEGEPKKKKIGNCQSEFSPTDVTLFSTSGCGLRCTYCYGNGGDVVIVLEWEPAKAAVDLIFKNAQIQKKKKVSVGFHGGGEPFFGEAFGLVKRIVEYAQSLSKETGIHVSFSSATNGVLSEDQREWIVQNFGNLNVSLDGPEDIQDVQRPLSSGEGSFRHVLKTIKFLEERNFKYGLRATITKQTCGRMKEIIDSFRSISSVKKFHFEPLFECGRCKTSGAEAPDPLEFTNAMIEAIQYANQFGIEIYYSGASINKVSDSFCGANGRNFCVTPQGNVTSCFEVSLDTDVRADLFFYGSYNKDENRFILNDDRLKHLKERTVYNIEGCSDCFIKFGCAGDCPAKILAMGDMFDTTKNPRCEINQTLSVFKLTEQLTKQGEQSGK